MSNSIAIIALLLGIYMYHWVVVLIIIVMLSTQITQSQESRLRLI